MRGPKQLAAATISEVMSHHRSLVLTFKTFCLCAIELPTGADQPLYYAAAAATSRLR